MTFSRTLFVLICFSLGAPAYAQDVPQPTGLISNMGEALIYAHNANPTLQAARAEMRAVEEYLPQAYAGFKPDAQVDTSIQAVDIEGSNFGGADGSTEKSATASFSQPLFRGGRTFAEIKEAKELINAQDALLRAAVQSVLLDAATAYTNVLEQKALLDLSENNRSVLSEELEAAQLRFDVGELTVTDVSQSEARLAEADSQVIAAVGGLKAAKGTFEQVVGAPAGTLAEVDVHPTLPPTLEEALEIAERQNPNVIAAEYTHEAAKADISATFRELLPEVSLDGSYNKAYDPVPGIIEDSTTKAIGLNATIPLYRSGAVRSRTRQARHVANQRLQEISEIRLAARQQTIAAWADLQAARAGIAARQKQVDSARLAYEGVREESIVGARTVLDILDANQELLDAEVSLVTAQSNEIEAEYRLAALLGILSVDNL